MLVNRIDIVIDKYRTQRNTLFGVIWQTDIPNKLEQHKILGQNGVFISIH